MNCRHILKIRPSSTHSVLDSQKWTCPVCTTSEQVWACLSCSNVACGRFLEDHARQHYLQSKHPLAMDVHDKYVYCYKCNGYIVNDNSSGDIKILRSCPATVSTDVSDVSSSVGSRRSSQRVQRSSSACGAPMQSLAGSISTASLSQWESSSNIAEPLAFTDLWFRRYYLLANAFSKWKRSTKGVMRLSEAEVTVDEKKEEDLEGCSHDTAVNERNSQPLNTESAESHLNGCVPSPLNYTQSRATPPTRVSSRRRTSSMSPGVTGLRNLGNTCYMNSILQVLRHLYQFSKVFVGEELSEREQGPAVRQTASLLSSPHIDGIQSARGAVTGAVEDVSNSGGFGARGVGINGRRTSQRSSDRREATRISLSQELNSLLRVMWSGKISMVSPHKMLYAVWDSIPFFRGYSQQDAHEFLSAHNTLLTITSDVMWIIPDLQSEFLLFHNTILQLLDTIERYRIVSILFCDDVSCSEFLDKVQLEMDSQFSSLTNGTSPATRVVNGMSGSVTGMTHDSMPSIASSTAQPPTSDDVVTQLFRGELVSRVTCLACGHKSDQREAFMDLSLEFPDRYQSVTRRVSVAAFAGSNGETPKRKRPTDSCNLEEMLARFTDVEKLEGQIYACDACNTSPKKRRKRHRPSTGGSNKNVSKRTDFSPLVGGSGGVAGDGLSMGGGAVGAGSTESRRVTTYSEAEKCFLLNRLPYVLRLHLKRFMWSGRSHRGKISTHVNFSETLDVKSYCHPDLCASTYLYNLSAVVVHHGRGFGSGHYTAYCWNDEAGSWLHCNDDKMRLVKISEVYNAQAYILVYTKTLTSPLHTPSPLSIPSQRTGEITPPEDSSIASSEIESTSDALSSLATSRIAKFSAQQSSVAGSRQMTWKRRKTTIW